MPSAAILALAFVLASAGTPFLSAQNAGNGGQGDGQGAAGTRSGNAQDLGQTSGAAATPGQQQGTQAPGAGTRRQRSSGGNSRNRSNHPVPASNGKVEVIGSDDDKQRGTSDRPLLPIAPLGNQLGIRSGTAIQVQLSQTVDSGHAHNGDMLDAVLAQPLGKLPSGTPVKLTVVQASAAGALLSFGELSLQVISIADHSVLSDTISAQGREGKKEQADSAPAIGTEAVFRAGEVISLPAA